MSTLTNNWTEEKIRTIITHLDEKTGLEAHKIPILFTNKSRTIIASYYHGDQYFLFNRRFFDDPDFTEGEALDTIRHEYAHYYTDVCNLHNIINPLGNYDSHGEEWKWACSMVNAYPYAIHKMGYTALTITPSNMDYYVTAQDVKPFDIRGYISKWGQIPPDAKGAAKTEKYLKSLGIYCEIGTEVLHPKMGFGTVIDSINASYQTQRVYVRFESGICQSFKTTELFKIANGVATPLAY